MIRWRILVLALAVDCGASRPPAPETPLPDEPALGRFVREVSSIAEHREAEGQTRMRILVGPGGLDSDRAAVARIELGPGRRVGPLAHPCFDVVVLVEAGAIATLGPDGPAMLGPGDSLYVPKGELLLLETEEEPAVFYQVFAAEEGVGACETVARTANDVPAPPVPDALLRTPRLRRHGEAESIVIAGGLGRVQMLVDPELQGSAFVYVGLFEGAAGLEVAAHVHEGSDEILVVRSGRGTLAIAGETIAVGAGSVVRIPAGTEHAFVALGPEPTRAIQIYAGPGPEERFRR